MLTERQKKILSAVVKEYTETAIPAGSRVIVNKYSFNLSPATIRNEMVELDRQGYLYQPHVSAGRIPTDKGYRYFVDAIMEDRELTLEEQKKLQKELLKLKAENTRLNRTVVKLLSALSGNLAISGVIDKNEFYDFGMHELLDQPEFHKLDEVCRLVEVLDCIDESMDEILEKLSGETKIFIGKENPIREIKNCSMVVSPYKTKRGERGILAIIGPKRMEYARNKSLVDYMKKLLGSSLVLLLLIDLIYDLRITI